MPRRRALPWVVGDRIGRWMSAREWFLQTSWIRARGLCIEQ